MSDETWKQLPGYGGHYDVSDMGRVRVRDRHVERKHPTGMIVKFFYPGRLLQPCASGRYGHQSVHVGVGGKRYSLAVHWMVLVTFVGPRPEGMEACHGNGNASDNRLENLRWDTHFENNQDRKRHGRYATGSKHVMAKLRDETVREIKQSGMNGSQVAQRYGIGASTAHRILTGKSWAHVSA